MFNGLWVGLGQAAACEAAAVLRFGAEAGLKLTLPQSNWVLDTAEPAGAAQLLVIVSQTERDFTRLSTDYSALFLQLPASEVGVAAKRAFTGPGSILAGVPRCESAGCEAFGAAQFSVEVVC